MMIRLLFLSSIVFLTGCAATSQWGEAKTGGAVYVYSHTDGDRTCNINGTSAREVEGVEIEIQSDCTMKITTVTSTPMTDMLGVIGGLVNRLPAPGEVPVP